jgi:ATP phosphoribosyltransferase
MSNAPLILAVPSKGRLQQNAEAFFARAGLSLVKPRGARDYRGAIAGLDGVEIAYLSASEITQQLAQGMVHLGITGEDLVREMIPRSEQRVVMVTGLGFGFANVVVAVPQAWIDVRNMADLDDVATAFRLKHERKMRLATKYANLTRGFFTEHGVVDYRIVESSGATEGAPAAGTAEMIVDITTTGTTLAANGLKVIDDGIILRSQANLVAARAAAWGAAQRDIARVIFDRIAAQKRASSFAEVRTRFAGLNETMLSAAKEKFGVVSPFGGPTSSGMLTLHCPPANVHALAGFLRDNGAEAVSVGALDYVYTRDNELYAKLAAELDAPH